MSISNIVQALELPHVAEGSVVNRTLQASMQASSSFLDLIEKEGIAYGYMNFHYNKKPPEAGGHLAVPVINNNDSLYRVIINFSGTATVDENKEELGVLPLLKVGFSGRRILQSKCIFGGYANVEIPFYEKGDLEHHKGVPAWLLNPGFEYIWPKHEVMVAGDFAFHPINLFGDSGTRCHRSSIKIGVIRPYKIDAFMAVSLIKEPYHSTKLHTTLLKVKGKLPISKWYLDKIFTVGLGGHYNMPINGNNLWNKNYMSVSVYVQMNAIFHSPTRSIRDYLRMPIDQSYIIPYHPGHSLKGSMHRSTVYNSWMEDIRGKTPEESPLFQATPTQLQIIEPTPISIVDLENSSTPPTHNNPGLSVTPAARPTTPPNQPPKNLFSHLRREKRGTKKPIQNAPSSGSLYTDALSNVTDSDTEDHPPSPR